jgi:putative ABC transport system permease protein
VTSGSLDRLGPGTIAMSDAAAQERHIGDTVQVTLGDGVKIRPRLVAIYTRGLGFGDTLLDYDDIIGHVDDPLATAILIKGSVTHRRRPGLHGADYRVHRDCRDQHPGHGNRRPVP